MTLAVWTKGLRDGYASLKITEKSTKRTSLLKKGECGSKDKDAGQTGIVIEHRGGRYGVPKEMKID